MGIYLNLLIYLCLNVKTSHVKHGHRWSEENHIANTKRKVESIV